MADKFYITTSIAYVNARPHIGFALELAQADAIARWQRLNDREVFFLSGADEHGAKIMRAAESAGKSVQEFVDQNTSFFKKLIKDLGVSTDDFIRTSDQKRHFPGAIELWEKLEASGDIYKKNYIGLYCVGHEAFITQKDLADGKCADHGVAPEKIEEENYFFRLSRFETELIALISSGRMRVFPDSRKNEMLAFLKNGLEDVSFSRPSKDISWGIPVPGDATQTMYVWCDALSNYITALGFGSDDLKKFKEFWPADLHNIGKDILRFHAIIWPAVLLSVGLPVPKGIFVHGFINVGGQKMSKSIGNVIDPLDFIKRHGRDALRYYLLREISTFEDADFTEGRFVEVYNADLANGLGNYISRVAKMVEQYFDGVLVRPSTEELTAVPIKKRSSFFAPGDEGTKMELISPPYLIDRIVWPAYRCAFENYQLKQVLDIVWTLLGELDAYVQIYEPFKLVKTDPKKTKAVLWNLSYGVLSLGWMLKPFLPDTADKILNAFGAGSNSKEEWKEIRVKLDGPLFTRKENVN
ncbi:MAG: methionine--tRNA ligase [Patescibacteria group bacterium]